MRKFISLFLALTMLLSCLYINVSASDELIENTTVELYQLAPEDQSLMECYVIKTPNDKLIVIDGGIDGAGLNNAPYLPSALRAIAGVGEGDYFEVDAWFLSHAHIDHYNELGKMLNEYDEDSNYKINNFYFDFPPFGEAGTIWENTLTAHEGFENFKDGLENYAEVNDIDVDKTYYDDLNGAVVNADAIAEGLDIVVDGVRFEIMQTYADADGVNELNSTSMILRMHTAGKTVLFLNDAYIPAGRRFLATYGEDVKSDYVQMAHHGQSGVLRDVYDAIDADFFLWPTPEWVWNNPDGYAIDDVRTWLTGADYLEPRENDLVAGMYDKYPEEPTKVSDWTEVLDGMKITFSPEDANYTAPKAIKNLRYTGEEQELVIEGCTDIGVMEYSLGGDNFSDAIPTAVNAGEYTVYYRIMDGGNKLLEEEVKVSIAKVVPEITAPLANEVYYTGEAQELVTEGVCEEGTFLYSLDDDEYTEEIPTATDSGYYTVYYKVEESENFLEASGLVEVTVGDYGVTFKNGNTKAPFDEPETVVVMDGETLLAVPAYEAKANTEPFYWMIDGEKYTTDELLSYEFTENTEVLAYFRESAIAECDYDFTKMTEEEFEFTAFSKDGKFELVEGTGIVLSTTGASSYAIPMSTDVTEKGMKVTYTFKGTSGKGSFNGHFKRNGANVASIYHTSSYLYVYGKGISAQQLPALGKPNDGARHTVEFFVDFENGKQILAMDGNVGIPENAGAYVPNGDKVPDSWNWYNPDANGCHLTLESLKVERVSDIKLREVDIAIGDGISAVNFMNVAGTSALAATSIYMVEGLKVPVKATLAADFEFEGWSADEGSFADDTSIATVYTAGSDDATITAEGAGASFDENDVARIGKVGYESLNAAITAANDGDTIILLKDITFESSIVLGNGKDFTINGDGYNLICGINVAGTNCFYVYADTMVTFENINIYRNNTTQNNYGFFYLSSGGVTLGDGAVVGKSDTQMVQGNGGVIWSQKSSTDTGTGKRYFTLNGEGAKLINIKGVWKMGAFDGSSSAEINLLKGTIDKCTHTTAFIGERGNFVVNLGDVTITNSKEPMVNGTTSTTVNITGSGTLGTVKAASNKISFKKTLTYGPDSLTYQGADFTGSVKLNVLDTTTPQSYAIVESGMNVTGAKLATGEDLMVNASGNLVIAEYVAKIGDKKYTSLQGAINAAATGDTITLLDDVTLDEQLLFNTGKSITIDGANFDIITNVAPSAPVYVAANTKVLFKNVDLKKGVATQNNYGFFRISAGSVTLGDYAVLGGTSSNIMKMGNGGVVWVQRDSGDTGRAYFTLNGEGAKIQYVKADWEKGVFDGSNELELHLLKGTITGCTSTKGLVLGKNYFTVRLGDVVIENSATPTVEGTSIYKVYITGKGSLGTIKAPSSKIYFAKSVIYDAGASTYQGGDFEGSVVLDITDTTAPSSYAIVESGMTVTGAKTADGKELYVDANGNLVIKPDTELTSASEVIYDESEENEVQFAFKALAGETPSALKNEKGEAVAYTYSEGTLTIDADYLKALENGTYALTLTFTNGKEFALSVVKTDTSKVNYVLAESEGGKGTGALVLTNLSGKAVKSVSYNNGTALDFTASDDGKTITIERYVFRANMDLYATLTLEEDGIVPVLVTFSDDTTKTYNVTVTSEWAAIPAIDEAAVFQADEIVPEVGAWKVRTSSANGGTVHPRYAFTGKLKNAKNSQNWHTGYTLVNDSPVGDSKLDHYIDVDFGTAPINYKGVRITERVSGSRYNNIAIWGKNAEADEWVQLFSGAAEATAPASNNLMFEETVTYRYMRMKFDGKSEHVTADIIHIIKGDHVNIQITPTTGGNVTVSTNGTSAPSMGDNFVAPNENVTFTATPEENENGGFMYWIEANTGRILGTGNSLTVKAATSKDIKAVFADPAATEVFVSFFGRGGFAVISHSYVKKGEAPKAPSIDKLYTTGYEFKYWVDSNGTKVDITSAVNENTEFHARYVAKSEKKSTITVVGGTVARGSAIGTTEGTFAYDTYVNVTADEPQTGKKFSHWEINGEVVSYEKIYKFFAPDVDITITAIFVDEETEVEKTVSITMTYTLDTVKDSEGKDVTVASFLTTRYVPRNIEVIETGVIYVKDASYGALTVAEVGKTSQNDKTVKVATSSKKNSGQYKLTSSYSEYGIKAVGFITYMDGDKAVTLYTDTITVE